MTDPTRTSGDSLLIVAVGAFTFFVIGLIAALLFTAAGHSGLWALMIATPTAVVAAQIVRIRLEIADETGQQHSVLPDGDDRFTRPDARHQSDDES